MNSTLPSSICGSASDSSYAATDRSSIRSSSHTSIKSISTASKPKRTVRFQDPVPEPIPSLADSVSFHPSPNLSLSSLDFSSDDNAPYTRRSRPSSSAAGKQPLRNSSPALSVGRPQIAREMSASSTASSTASAPGELEFSDWLARMEESRARPGSPLKGGKASTRGAREEEERKKKKLRSWVNLLVR